MLKGDIFMASKPGRKNENWQKNPITCLIKAVGRILVTELNVSEPDALPYAERLLPFLYNYIEKTPTQGHKFYCRSRAPLRSENKKITPYLESARAIVRAGKPVSASYFIALSARIHDPDGFLSLFGL
jgi:hypothetical protein